MSSYTDEIVGAAETFSRRLCNNSTTMTGGLLRLSYFTWESDTIVPTQIECRAQSTQSGTAPTVARMGLWVVNSDGSLTLVNSTAHDSTLWNATTRAAGRRTFTGSHTPVLGQRYAAGALFVSVGTSPALVGNVPSGVSAFFGSDYSPRLAANYSAQADIGNLAAPTSTNDATAQLWFALT